MSRSRESSRVRVALIGMAVQADSGPSAPRSQRVEVAPGTWMRRPMFTLGSAACWLGFFALFVYLAVYVAVLKQHWHTTPANRWGLVALMTVIAVPCGIVAIRFARAGVWMAADGIVLRGPLRTRTVRLDDVERFAPKSGNNQQPFPWLQRTHDRRSLAVTALSHGILRSRGARYLPALCDDLNAVLKSLQEHRVSSVAVDPTAARAEAARERRHERAWLMGSVVVSWAVAGILIAAHPTTVTEVGYGGGAALYTATTAIIIRSVRKRPNPSQDSLNSTDPRKH